MMEDDDNWITFDMEALHHDGVPIYVMADGCQVLYIISFTQYLKIPLSKSY